MEYANLGSSGLKISKVVLGAMSYGDSRWSGWVKNEDESLPLLKAAFDHGITTWDTADVYSGGTSERLIGKAIKQYNIPRNELVIMTKCYFGVVEDMSAMWETGRKTARWANGTGLSRKHIFDAVDASVERLGTYIDVLQIHRLDRETSKEEIMKALHDVVSSGKVRYIGASSMFAWEFQMLQNIAEKHNWTKFISMQGFYNLLYREEEREMIPYCKETGVGLIPWSPLARGALTRPFDSRSTVRETTDLYIKRGVRDHETDHDAEIVKRVEEIAKKYKTSMAIVATAWVLSRGALPIVGLSSVERIEEAVESVKFKLSEKEIKYLEEPYAPKVVEGILV